MLLLVAIFDNQNLSNTGGFHHVHPAVLRYMLLGILVKQCVSSVSSVPNRLANMTLLKYSKKNAITYLDDVFMQSQTKDEMFIVLEKYHQVLLQENMITVLQHLSSSILFSQQSRGSTLVSLFLQKLLWRHNVTFLYGSFFNTSSFSLPS